MPSRELLGSYRPGRTPWHRLSVGWKYLAFLGLVIASVVAPAPWGVLALVATGVLVATTGAPLRVAWGIPLGLALLVAALAAYQALTGQWATGVAVASTLLTALYASRLVLLTTPMPQLIDALVAAARPFRLLGLDPERFALAVAIMVRSIPFVTGAFATTRDAARARGLERSPLALVTPVVVQTVAFARQTGDALAARGLGE